MSYSGIYYYSILTDKRLMPKIHSVTISLIFDKVFSIKKLIPNYFEN